MIANLMVSVSEAEEWHALLFCRNCKVENR